MIRAAITGQDISAMRNITLLSGLTLEVKTGMKLTRGRTCYALIKAEHGLKGNKRNVLRQYANLIYNEYGPGPVVDSALKLIESWDKRIE